MSGKPITPAQVCRAHAENFPPEVIEAFNELIAVGWNGKSSTVKQKDAVAAVRRKTGLSEREVYDRHLLDVEAVFERAGWSVEYDKPGYCDNWYEPYFVFKPKK